MSAIATTHEGSLRPIALHLDEHIRLEADDLLPGQPEIQPPDRAAVREISGPSSSRPEPVDAHTADPHPAGAEVDAGEIPVEDAGAAPAPISRPRPARTDQLLRRCASLAARARVDAITDLDAKSLGDLRAVLAEIHVATASSEAPPRAPLPCLAAAALEDLRHQLDQQAEDPSAARALGEVDRALALLADLRTAAE